MFPNTCSTHTHTHTLSSHPLPFAAPPPPHTPARGSGRSPCSPPDTPPAYPCLPPSVPTGSAPPHPTDRPQLRSAPLPAPPAPSPPHPSQAGHKAALRPAPSLPPRSHSSPRFPHRPHPGGAHPSPPFSPQAPFPSLSGAPFRSQARHTTTPSTDAPDAAVTGRAPPPLTHSAEPPGPGPSAGLGVMVRAGSTGFLLAGMAGPRRACGPSGAGHEAKGAGPGGGRNRKGRGVGNGRVEDTSRSLARAGCGGRVRGWREGSGEAEPAGLRRPLPVPAVRPRGGALGRLGSPAGRVVPGRRPGGGRRSGCPLPGARSSRLRFEAIKCGVKAVPSLLPVPPGQRALCRR